MCDVTPEELATMVRALISAQATSLGLEITTPIMFPNGDAVSVVVAHEGDSCVVHDGGFGAMHFASFGGRLTKGVTDRLRELAARYGCEFSRGRVSRRCSREQLAVACAVVANASRTIGDQVSELRRYAESEFKNRLSEVVKEIAGSRLRQNETIRGHSGRSYRVENVILDQTEQRPVAFVVPIPNRAATLPSFAEMFDIKKVYSSVINDFVYNEESDIREEDIRLLQNVGMPYTIPGVRAQLKATVLQ